MFQTGFGFFGETNSGANHRHSGTTINKREGRSHSDPTPASRNAHLSMAHTGLPILKDLTSIIFKWENDLENTIQQSQAAEILCIIIKGVLNKLTSNTEKMNLYIRPDVYPIKSFQECYKLKFRLLILPEDINGPVSLDKIKVAIITDELPCKFDVKYYHAPAYLKFEKKPSGDFEANIISFQDDENPEKTGIFIKNFIEVTDSKIEMTGFKKVETIKQYQKSIMEITKNKAQCLVTGLNLVSKNRYLHYVSLISNSYFPLKTLYAVLDENKLDYDVKEYLHVINILVKKIGEINDKQYLHNDLKTNNILVITENNDDDKISSKQSLVKIRIKDLIIIDLDEALKITKQSAKINLTGMYASPEILSLGIMDQQVEVDLSEGFEKSDLFSMGMIIMFLLGFSTDSLENYNENIWYSMKKNELIWDDFIKEILNKFFVNDMVKSQFVNLLKGLLEFNPEKRFGYNEVKQELDRISASFENTDGDSISFSMSRITFGS